MSKWKSAGTKLTEEELNDLLTCIELYNKENNTTYNMNSFLRRMIKIYTKKKFSTINKIN